MPMRVVSVRLLEFKRSSHYSAVILSVGATQYIYIFPFFLSFLLLLHSSIFFFWKIHKSKKCSVFILLLPYKSRALRIDEYQSQPSAATATAMRLKPTHKKSKMTILYTSYWLLQSQWTTKCYQSPIWWQQMEERFHLATEAIYLFATVSRLPTTTTTTTTTTNRCFDYLQTKTEEQKVKANMRTISTE